MKQFTVRGLLVTMALAAFQWTAFSQQWDWAQKIDPIVDDYSRLEVLAVDEEGDAYYLTGRIMGRVSYKNIVNNTCTASSSSLYTYDVFVAKADNTGRIYWFVTGGQDDGNDQGNDIAVLGNRLVVTGYIGKDGISGNDAVFSNNPLPACTSAVTTKVIPVYPTGNRKAFIACYNVSTGSMYWVSGLDDAGGSPESEGRGISADPTGSGRFFVTGYYKGSIEFGQYYDDDSGTPTACTAQCTDPLYYPYYETSIPANAYNTFVMQFYDNGCSNWFTKFFGDPDGTDGDNWNAGLDIAAYADGDENSVFVTGSFTGSLRQLSYPTWVTDTTDTGFFDIVQSTHEQAGYIIKLEYSGGGWSGYYSTPCEYIYPIGGLVSWNGDYDDPVYSVQKLECTDDGMVVPQSLAVRAGGSGTPQPVVVGTWFDHTIGLPTLQANHQGSAQTVTNGSSTGYYTDVFITQYADDLLSCDWITSISSDADDWVGGINENTPFYKGGDGACGVAYSSDGNIYVTGSFTGSCDVNSVSSGPVTLTSSSGDGSDLDAYIVKYDANGDNVFAEIMMAACDSPRDDYGSAVSGETNGYTGGYFAGYSYGDLGVNQNCPIGETVLAQSTDFSTMSYYGSHAPEVCLSPGMTPVNVMPSVNYEFRVLRTPLNDTKATVQYYLPAGSYNVAYRNPLTSNPHECVDGLVAGWVNVPRSVLAPGFGSFVVGTPGGVGPALNPGIVPYEWYIQGRCLGRWGMIDPNDFDSAKRGKAAESEGTDNGMNIYPNPAGNMATISFAEPVMEAYRVEVFDVNGKKVTGWSFAAGSPTHQDIDVSGLSAGLYCVKVLLTESNNQYIRSLVKE